MPASGSAAVEATRDGAAVKRPPGANELSGRAPAHSFQARTRPPVPSATPPGRNMSWPAAAMVKEPSECETTVKGVEEPAPPAGGEAGSAARKGTRYAAATAARRSCSRQADP